MEYLDFVYSIVDAVSIVVSLFLDLKKSIALITQSFLSNWSHSLYVV